MRSAFAALGFAACLAPAPTLAQAGAYDPWEGVNRNLYAAHEAVDRAVLEPAARGYRAVTPGFFRAGVRNVLNNLRGPVILANDLLQAEPARAGVTLARFGVNTTIGVLGLFDPAAAMGLERHDEDFGQTLAVWGVPAGPYLFVPVLGPTNARDGAGRLVDLAFDPLTWARGEHVGEARTARGVARGLSVREQLIEPVEDVRRDSLDAYVTIRTAYDLLRASAIQNGRAEIQDLPDFDDEYDIPDEEEAQAPGAYGQHFKTDRTPPKHAFLARAQRAPTSALIEGDKS